MNILGSYSWYVSIGLDNGLLPIWCQAIIEIINNSAPFHYVFTRPRWFNTDIWQGSPGSLPVIFSHTIQIWLSRPQW